MHLRTAGNKLTIETKKVCTDKDCRPWRFLWGTTTTPRTVMRQDSDHSRSVMNGSRTSAQP